MPKFYEVPVVGTGLSDDPYRPDVPEGVSWTATDGQQQGGFGSTGGKGTGAHHPETGEEGMTHKTGGTMLVMIPDEDDDAMGAKGKDLDTRKQKLREAHQSLSSNPKVKQLRKRKDLTNKERNDLAKVDGDTEAMKVAAPKDSVPGAVLKYKLTEAELSSWRA